MATGTRGSWAANLYCTVLLVSTHTAVDIHRGRRVAEKAAGLSLFLLAPCVCLSRPAHGGP